MKKMRLSLIVLTSAILCSALVSCKKDYVGKENTHPVFVNAKTAQKSGKYEEAAKLFEEFLLVAPKSAETHKQLAALYGDDLDSPVKAIYHYEKVLELKPDDPDSESYRSFIGVARKKLYEQLKKEFRDEEKEAAQKAELEEARRLLARYKIFAQQLKDRLYSENRKWKERLRQAEQGNGPARVAVPVGGKKTPSPAPSAAKPEAGRSASTPAAGEKAASPAGAKALGRHTVKSGESLRSIARKYYGSAKYYKLIAEANKGKLPANLAVRVGQELVIPQKPSK